MIGVSEFEKNVEELKGFFFFGSPYHWMAAVPNFASFSLLDFSDISI